LGTGSVGGTLGRRWLELGHDVMFGSRDPGAEKVLALGGKAGSMAEAIAYGETVLVALPWSHSRPILTGFDFRGKILLDAMNPLKPDLSGLFHEGEKAGGQLVADWALGSRVVKIFNTTGWNNMADPSYPSGPLTMLYCGDDVEAKQTAADLAREIGFQPEDAGGLHESYLLENLALLWIRMSVFGGHGRDIAINLVRR